MAYLCHKNISIVHISCLQDFSTEYCLLELQIITQLGIDLSESYFCPNYRLLTFCLDSRYWFLIILALISFLRAFSWCCVLDVMFYILQRTLWWALSHVSLSITPGSIIIIPFLQMRKLVLSYLLVLFQANLSGFLFIICKKGWW